VTSFRQGIKIFILILAQCAFVKAMAFECAGYLNAPVKLQSPYTTAIEQFDFPEEANFFIFERVMRIAIHEAHGGVDYYTREPLPFDEMTLDHIIPRSKNGPDNVFNFVPTSGQENNKKGNSFTAKDLETLEEVRTIYGLKTMELLRHYGAFENREEDFEKAKQASYRRRNYKRSKEFNLKPDVTALIAKSPTVFRRSSDKPSREVIKLLLVFARELALLNEKEFDAVATEKTFQFKIDEHFAPNIDAESLEASYGVILSYRRQGAKIADESMALKTNLFEIVDYNLDRRRNVREINIRFHPMFALKLLKMPVSNIMAVKFVESFFRPSDITRDEYIEWAE
jgi:hypothetical protein